MNSHETTDRETLSALFDGELQGDARRFASRRLAHDTGWQEDCGRWQLMGDAMRRQAPIVAPADFASRVERAIAAEAVSPAPALVAPVAPVSTRRPVRLWAGGAVAASLALLAVFANRSPQTVTTAAPPALAAAPSATTSSRTPDARAIATPALIAAAEPTVADPAPLAAAATAPRATAPEVTPRRVAAVAAARVPARIQDARPAVVAPQRAASAVLAAATFTPPDATNPFHVPAADPLASRPWPRAAVSSGGALTASYGTQVESRGDSPSFYPFEPHTHADAAVRAESP